MKVTILKYPGADDWMFVKRCALVTVDKKPVNPPDEEWKREMLRARHSPIRELQFAFLIEDVPFWVMGHLVRHHVGCQPYVKTSRTDRTGVDRSTLAQDAPVNMIWTMNADALITIAEKRLCHMAAKETREVVRMMCKAVLEVCPEFDAELLAPCMKYGVCRELHGGCGRWRT